MIATLKFESQHVEPIWSGAKTLTARYEGPDVREGDTLELRTQDGKWFASVPVKWTDTTTIREFADHEYDGHRQYTTRMDCLAEFRRYYHGQLRLDTELDVYGWGDLLDVEERGTA